MEPTVSAGKEVAPFFMELVLVAHTVLRTAKDMAGTVVERDYYHTEHKQQRLSKTVMKYLPHAGSDIEHVFAALSVRTKEDFEAIVERCMTQ